MYNRPKDVRVYNPLKPEYEVAESLVAESYRYASPNMLWFSIKQDVNLNSFDELDRVYGESTHAKEIFDDPKTFYGIAEINPIIEELTRLGLETTQEITLFCSIDDLVRRIGKEPKSGDIFRIDYLNSTNNRDDIKLFYRVSTVLPSSMYNFKYMDLSITGEQQNLSNVESDVRNFLQME